MFSIALVVFREVFEIALIVSILMAATKGLEKRTQWVMIGILAGIAGAVVIAFFADTISQLAQGMGQEMLNASILFIAAGLIGWTTLWMNRNGRQLSESFKRIGQEVIKGEPLLVLSAMKMENQIVAPCNGVISGLIYEEGQSVPANQLLLQIE